MSGSKPPVVVGRDGGARFSIIGEVDWTGEAAHRWLAPCWQRRRADPFVAYRPLQEMP
jgi:hypothetical protein